MEGDSSIHTFEYCLQEAKRYCYEILSENTVNEKRMKIGMKGLVQLCLSSKDQRCHELLEQAYIVFSNKLTENYLKTRLKA